MLASYKMTGRKRLSQLVKYESNPEFTREVFTLLAGSGSTRTAALGALLAMTFGAGAISVSQAADPGNTGDGVLTLADPAFTSSIQPGEYTVVCTTGGADGVSKFRVEDPEGKQVATATGGTAFTKQIKFTISGGSAAFVEGDRFVVTVAAELGDPSNKIVLWDPNASDGTERIWGVCLREIAAADGVDAEGGLALRRGDAILAANEIVWPNGITDDQKAEAIVALEAMRILAR